MFQNYLLLFSLSFNAAGANLRFPLNILINLFLTLTTTIQSRQEELNDSNAQVGVIFVKISSVEKYTLGYAIKICIIAYAIVHNFLSRTVECNF